MFYCRALQQFRFKAIVFIDGILCGDIGWGVWGWGVCVHQNVVEFKIPYLKNINNGHQAASN